MKLLILDCRKFFILYKLFSCRKSILLALKIRWKLGIWVPSYLKPIIKGLLKKDGQDKASEGDINSAILEKQKEIQKIIYTLSADEGIYSPNETYESLKKFS